MRVFIVALSALLVAAIAGSYAAHAHSSSVPHAHPHESVVVNALLSDATAGIVIALGLILLAGGGLIRARRRR